MEPRPLARRALTCLVTALTVAALCTSVHAQPGAAKPKNKQAARFNAHMTVSCLREGKVLKSWSRPTAWNGPIPAQYTGDVRNGAIAWRGTAPITRNIRIHTSLSGQGGKRLIDWIHPDTAEVHIAVEWPQDANGSSPIGSASASSKSKPSQTKKTKKPKRYNLTERPANPPPPSTAERKAPKSSTTTANASRTKSGEHSSTQDPIMGTGQGRDQSERAKAAHVRGTGTLQGRIEGMEQGKAGGKTEREGGVDSANDTLLGQGTVAHGMKGGTGDNDAQGVPSGGGLIGLINVPVALRTLTETMLLLEDANPGKLAASWIGKVTKKTTARSLRKRLKKEARDYARSRMGKNATAITKETRDMSTEEASRYVRRLHWEIERQYFDNAAKGAAGRVRRLQAKVDKGTATAKEIAELPKARMLRDAAQVKPLAGQLPRNHSYAGKAFPADKLPKKHRAQGIHIKPNGHADFGPHAVRLPNGSRSVKIKLTGNQVRDTTLAKKAAGYTKSKQPPKGYTWHHYEDGTTMQLVPEDLPTRCDTRAGGLRISIARAIALHTEDSSMGFKLARSGRNLNEADIAKFEARLEARLPAEYRRFLLETNGGWIEGGHFGADVVTRFYGVSNKRGFQNIYQVIRTLRGELPSEVIPIALGVFGDMICLAIKGENRGRVYRWNHEGGVPAYDPWLELRGMLYPDRYPDDKPPYEHPLDWPGHPDLTLIAEDFSAFLDTYQPEPPSE